MANLILLGFMGAGKSVVGQRLAQRLGYRFLDTDKRIEAKAEKSISQIFAEYGELHFRRLERELVGKLTEINNAVIATGGGMAVDPDNLRRLKTLGRLVYLRAAAETILPRILNGHHRPLLFPTHPDRQLQKIKGLLIQREPYYNQADHIIDTSNLSVPETVGEVLKWWENRP